uniref:Ig-like domain-containing protein n=1 Tax=Periophthalmus magnuspinnatus TaxID=409849 RepID=A0A3B3ZS01_9GOBI
LCSSVHVFVRDERRYAVLFQSVVLPCQYNSVSTQTPVVQWVYKSYCRDRRYETGTASYLDCADSGRTVRTVASVSGSSITLSEYYKTRDISVINKADLRIGEVQWGDSGVYICKVIISDDLEGQNEASVELLVLGLSAVPEDLLPGFDLKIMPEWVFVGAVALGSVLFLLLVGVCWCQCCPHSCCCYVSCWCCPDTCCCPRHLYEAGKGIKTGPSTPLYPPYFVSGVPAMVPITPPSLVDKASVSVPPSDATLVTGKQHLILYLVHLIVFKHRAFV